MNRFGRRQLLSAGAAAAVTPRLRAFAFGNPLQSSGYKPQPLDLKDYQPKSMLHVKESRVEKPRFPVIDVHTHLGFVAKSQGGIPVGEEMSYIWPPERLLEVMDRKNLRILVNLTGGAGKGLEESVRRYDKAYPGRFLPFATAASP